MSRSIGVGIGRIKKLPSHGNAMRMASGQKAEERINVYYHLPFSLFLISIYDKVLFRLKTRSQNPFFSTVSVTAFLSKIQTRTTRLPKV